MSVSAKRGCFLGILLMLVPAGAIAGSIQINGNCVLGTCPPVTGPTDALQSGQSIGPTTGSYDLSFLNGDTYTISWTFSASYSDAGTQLSVDPVATYTGASPSVGNDVIDFSFYQNFYDATPGTWDGDYSESVALSMQGNVGAGSTAEGELFWDGQGLGLVGPSGPGYFVGKNTVSLTGLNDSTLSAEYDFTYDFQAGTQQGAGVSSPAPEPSEAVAVMVAVAAAMLWRRRSSRCKLGHSR
jgi:hypothetical protein